MALPLHILALHALALRALAHTVAITLAGLALVHAIAEALTLRALAHAISITLAGLTLIHAIALARLAIPLALLTAPLTILALAHSETLALLTLVHAISVAVALAIPLTVLAVIVVALAPHLTLAVLVPHLALTVLVPHWCRSVRIVHLSLHALTIRSPHRGRTVLIICRSLGVHLRLRRCTVIRALGDGDRRTTGEGQHTCHKERGEGERRLCHLSKP
ncbi:MAG: hypothetical protein KDC54_21385 [Lewinella sp.]|nr:hypothetical protein [Lewinella sp.]